MKSIQARLTVTEKSLITSLRNLNVFELKDLINQLKNLITISKVTNDNLDIAYIDQITNDLLDVLKEREFEVLRKLNRRKQISNDVSNNNFSDNTKSSTIKSQNISNDIQKDENVNNDSDKNMPENNLDTGMPLLEKLKARNYKKIISIQQKGAL